VSASTSQLQVNLITEDAVHDVALHYISENVVDLTAAHAASGATPSGWNHIVVQVLKYLHAFVCTGISVPAEYVVLEYPYAFVCTGISVPAENCVLAYPYWRLFRTGISVPAE
jgi:hypothetical protein